MFVIIRFADISALGVNFPSNGAVPGFRSSILLARDPNLPSRVLAGRLSCRVRQDGWAADLQGAIVQSCGTFPGAEGVSVPDILNLTPAACQGAPWLRPGRKYVNRGGWVPVVIASMSRRESHILGSGAQGALLLNHPIMFYHIGLNRADPCK